MADEADMAQELEELALKHALANRKEGVHLPPKGYCYNCDESLKPHKVGKELRHVRLFCDEACRDDWEKLQAAKQRRVF
jgi:hypothetical protein